MERCLDLHRFPTARCLGVILDRGGLYKVHPGVRSDVESAFAWPPWSSRLLNGTHRRFLALRMAAITCELWWRLC